MTPRILILVATVAVLGMSTVWADPITITVGNPGNQGTDNVLFNDGTLQHSGSFVQGNFNGGGNGYVVRFTSSSGSGLLVGNGGQASIEGGIGNNPFTNLTFGLENGATFTNAILNPDANMNGMISFTVVYIMGAGSPYMQTFSINGNGQNFFGISAGMGARIVSVTFDTTGASIVDAAQFRLGGFAPAVGVPEGGATLMLLGAGWAGVALLRRKLQKFPVA